MRNIRHSLALDGVPPSHATIKAADITASAAVFTTLKRCLVE
ncbi:MAG TPA: hypothetical protein VMU03_09600 [Gammaproteobacteria bacterium]|nr:hypothetical protein [Gammaproteobacteria bacterium]